MSAGVPLPSRSEARSILRYLRDGTVPESGVELLTVGRDGWVRSFGQDLDDVAQGDKQVRLINGRYGDGKTHMMALLGGMAFKKGFVVSFVTIGSAVPLSRWDLLYKAVVTSLETNDRRRRGGLCGLVAAANPDPQVAEAFAERARRLRSLSNIDGSFAAAAYGYTTGQGASFDPVEDMLVFRTWLEGNSVSADARRPLGLQTNIDRANAQRMFQSLVALLRHFGYPGLLLLLDEVESTLDQRESVRSAAYDNLRSVIDRRDLPNGCFVVCSITPEMFGDEERGIRSYEALWQRLKPVGERSGVAFDATVADLTASPLTPNDYRKVGERIRAVHEIANEWDAGERVKDSFLIEAGKTAAGARSLAVAGTRIFVKVITDELDRAHADVRYVPDTRRLPVQFDQVARKLSAGRSADEWRSS